MFFVVFVFFVVVFLVNLVGLFLAILCFDSIVFLFFYVFHFLLESTFSVEAGVIMQGQMNRILCVPNQI